MAKAKKLPSGNWRVRLYTGKDANGKAVYKSFTAPSRREAEAALYAVRKKEKEEIGMTVGEAIDAYIRSKENVLSPTTIRSYRSYRKSYHRQLFFKAMRDDVTRNMPRQRSFHRFKRPFLGSNPTISAILGAAP